MARKCRWPVGTERSLWQETEASVLQSQGNEFCQQHGEPGSLFPVQPVISSQAHLISGWQPGKTLKQRSQISCSQTSDLQKLLGNKMGVVLSQEAYSNLLYSNRKLIHKKPIFSNVVRHHLRTFRSTRDHVQDSRPIRLKRCQKIPKS